MASIDFVIFDMDGVLADSEILSAHLLVRELAKHSVKLDEADVYKHFIGKSFPLVVGKIQKNFEVDLPENFETNYCARLLGTLSARLKPTQGFHEMLAQLGPQACVASSSSPTRVAHTLETIGMTNYFGNRVFTASQVARGKPALDLFLLAAKMMDVAPSRCLVLEDSAVVVQAGLAAAMQVWRYVDGSHFDNDGDAQHASSLGVSTLRSWRQFYSLEPGLKG